MRLVVPLFDDGRQLVMVLFRMMSAKQQLSMLSHSENIRLRAATIATVVGSEMTIILIPVFNLLSECFHVRFLPAVCTPYQSMRTDTRNEKALCFAERVLIPRNCRADTGLI